VELDVVKNELADLEAAPSRRRRPADFVISEIERLRPEVMEGECAS